MIAAKSRWLSLAWVSMAVALIAAPPLSAASLTSVVTDPVGDTSVHDQAVVIAEYQDIVEASITLKGGKFILVMDVAAPIPSTPALPVGVKLLDWSFRLRTNSTAVPPGFPWAPGDKIHPTEFVIFILWNGASFTGILIDRRPLLTGGEAIVTPIPFSIQGAEITASDDAVMIGNPQTFQWRSTTDIWFTDLGTEAFFQPDSAPDFGTVPWPL